VSELGSIFESTPGRRSGAKGPDLRVRVTVKRSELGGSEGVAVAVPDRVPVEGGTVARCLGPDDSPGRVLLHLSPQLGEQATLRLRGQGGESPSSGVAGDLFVELTIVSERSGGLWVMALAAVAVAAAWASHGVWWG